MTHLCPSSLRDPTAGLVAGLVILVVVVVLVIVVVVVVVVEVVHLDVFVRDSPGGRPAAAAPRLGLHAVLLHGRRHHHAVLVGLGVRKLNLFPEKIAEISVLKTIKKGLTLNTRDITPSDKGSKAAAAAGGVLNKRHDDLGEGLLFYTDLKYRKSLVFKALSSGHDDGIRDQSAATAAKFSPHHSLDYVFVLLVLALGVLPPAVHDGGVHVGRAVRVGLVQQADHGQQNRPEKRIKYACHLR